MATAKATVFIGGTKLLPYQVQVDQRVDWHHRFQITVSTEKAKVLTEGGNNAESDIINNAITYAGEIAEISIERSQGRSMHFKGYITDVNIDHTYAGDAFVIFKGYAPTYLLDGHKSVASYEDMTLEDIFADVMKSFPANTAKEVNPKYTDPIPYVVRHKETQYQFLSRLASTYGEWFYYDGQQIVFGDLPAEPPQVELTFGSDSMLSFNYGINLRPTNFKQQFYKYEDNAPVEQSVASFEPGWLDTHSKSALTTSSDLFPEEALDPVNHAVKDSTHITHLAESKKSAILSDVMLFTGQSADPRVTIGAEVEVSSRNGHIGKYRVISVSHTLSSNNDYYNMFRAIPATSMSPPTNRSVVQPEAEPQVGTITDNNDPDKLGRVRVQLKWQEGQTPWIRVQTNHAGEDRGEGIYGTYFIPEIGDEVMVEFEQGNPARPYVIGSLYHGNIPSEFADAENNLKAIKTRSGHVLQFDDTDGDEKILLTDKNGNLLTIETNGDSITINAGEHISIKAGTSISIEAGQTISLRSAESITLSSGNINQIAGSSVNVSAVSSYNLLTKNKMETVAANTMLKTKNLTNYVSNDFSSTAETINQTAKKNINSKAKKNILISADSKLSQRGGSVDVNAKKGKVRVKAKGNTELKGRQVKSN